MEFYAAYIDGSIHPLHNSDDEQLRKLKNKHEYKFVVTEPRNYEFHKKYFAMLNAGYQNQEQYNNFEHFRIVCQMKAGYYEAIETDKGTIYNPVSISFASMDELEFQAVYSKVLDVLIQMIGFDKEDFEREILNFM